MFVCDSKVLDMETEVQIAPSVLTLRISGKQRNPVWASEDVSLQSNGSFFPLWAASVFTISQASLQLDTSNHCSKAIEGEQEAQPLQDSFLQS